MQFQCDPLYCKPPPPGGRHLGGATLSTILLSATTSASKAAYEALNASWRLLRMETALLSSVSVAFSDCTSCMI